MTDKLESMESVGSDQLFTFVDKMGFVTQIRLDEEEMKKLRAVIDEHLWQTQGRYKMPIRE